MSKDTDGLCMYVYMSMTDDNQAVTLRADDKVRLVRECSVTALVAPEQRNEAEAADCTAQPL